MNLENIIERHIDMDPPNSHGWRAVLCPVCHDHGRKGKRAGWNFSDGAAYSCFNCGTGARFTIGSRFNKGMLAVLDSHGVTRDELGEFYMSSLADSPGPILPAERKIDFEPPIIEMPEHWELIDNSHDIWATVARAYLEDRCIDTSQEFYISRHPKFKARVIIPIRKNGKLIYFQARDMTDKKKDKYLSADIVKDNVLFGFNRLYEQSPAPLFVTEGIFDAMLVNGIALLGNRMTDGQKHWLSTARRKPTIIPDRWGDGIKIAQTFISLGWSVALPDFSVDVKDVNAAVQRHGKLYVTKTLMDNIYSGDLALMRLEVWKITSNSKEKKQKR